MPSVTPDEFKTSTQSSVDTTLESKFVSSTPLIALSTLSDNLTIEVTSSEEVSTDRLRETTLNPSSNEESGEEVTDPEIVPTISYPEENNSSEEVGSGEEEEEATERFTTEYFETEEPFNVNLTTSQLGNKKIINSLLSNFINA